MQTRVVQRYRQHISWMTTLNCSLLGSVLLSLKTKTLLLFYAFFEFSIVPITMIVFQYGYQPEKLQASISLLLYTVVGRLPLLLFIILFHTWGYTRTLLAIPITLAFMIKTPLYLLHAWLPKAHVEAPIGGSIMLAGVLLKLGSYGLLLFLPWVKINWLVSLYLRVALVGSRVRALICLRQGDVKLLIAYSSIVHIGVATLGFLRGTELGYSCGSMMVVSHGFTSPFLFAISYWLYCSSHSRLLANNFRPFPMLSGLLAGMISLNISVPPRLGLWSEVLFTTCTLSIINRVWPVFIAFFFLSALYNFYLYTSCMHSKITRIDKYIGISSLFPVIQVIFFGYASFLVVDLFHI